MASAALYYAALVLLALATTTTALDCYTCSGCEEGQRGNPIECTASQDSCIKVVLGTRIEKSCVQSHACQLGEVEKGLSDIFNDLTSSITGDAKKSSADSRVIHCCDTDYCNAATGTAPVTVLLLLAPLVLSALLR